MQMCLGSTQKVLAGRLKEEVFLIFIFLLIFIHLLIFIMHFIKCCKSDDFSFAYSGYISVVIYSQSIHYPKKP